jgi:hypothetical protein
MIFLGGGGEYAEPTKSAAPQRSKTASGKPSLVSAELSRGSTLREDSPREIAPDAQPAVYWTKVPLPALAVAGGGGSLDCALAARFRWSAAPNFLLMHERNNNSQTGANQTSTNGGHCR